MDCPVCSVKMERADLDSYFTAVKPDYAFYCLTCHRTLLVVTVIGEEDLLIWKDEIPVSYPFTEFLNDKLEERRSSGQNN